MEFTSSSCLPQELARLFMQRCSLEASQKVMVQSTILSKHYLIVAKKKESRETIHTDHFVCGARAFSEELEFTRIGNEMSRFRPVIVMRTFRSCSVALHRNLNIRRLVSHRNVKIPSRNCDENHPDHADQWRFIRQKSIPQMLRTVWVGDGLKESHPNLGGHWVHFLAGAIGDTVGSFVYGPCEVIKQRMQIQSTSSSWSSFISRKSVPVKPRGDMYGYYTGMFQAGCSIWKEQGPKGLYAGYWSTLARDVPFAGLMVSFYEALKDLTDEGKKKFPQFGVNSSVEGLVLGGLAGGLGAYLTTPLDVVKTRLPVQGTTIKYVQGVVGCSGSDTEEGRSRVMLYLPASALTFMAVEFLRESFREKGKNNNVVSNLSIESKRSSVHEVREN
ncbi:hypothetical protein Bca52824_052965 [Brassica carinata]|uniref:Mitochondrial carrier protein n=1 Tax=Brassica carinata TaxID=52824 RepID=A0A8X7UJ78_BRACI|nr:hypothetical protein Bca52824_052965 [Brassica carinata]